MSTNGDGRLLVCPRARLPLRELELEEADRRAGARLTARPPDEAGPFGRTPTVLARSDDACAYPVVDGIPVLLAPEVLAPAERRPSFDLTAPRYAEAYEEMAYYNPVGERLASEVAASPAARELAPARRASEAERASFPDPPAVWLDAVYEPVAQWEAYRHVAPLAGKRVLQVGGGGTHAVKFLLAGAAEAWILSPMVGELAFASALARHVGVGERLHCVAGVAEELPFADESFDAVYGGGTVHHMVTGDALPECARVLAPGGRFAAVEPWRAPLYRIGIRVFGKREPVHCRPLTPARVAPLYGAFEQAEVIHHGALTRYPLLAASKLGLSLPLAAVWRATRLDDAVASALPRLRASGSSVALLGARAQPSEA